MTLARAKRCAIVLAATAGLIIALAGCGSSGSGGTGNATGAAAKWPPASKGSVTLHVLMVHEIVYSDSALKQMNKAFEAAHPNVKIQMDFVSYNALHDKIVTDQIGGSGTYDVVVMDNIWPAEFASARIVRNLTNHIPQSYLKRTFPLVWHAVSYKGQVYGVPWGGIAIKHLYYNKKMLTQAGIKAPPRTWTQLVADSKILKAKGIVQYPYVATWAQSESLITDWAQMASAFGAKSLTSPSGQPTFDSGPALQALEFMRSMVKQGIANPASLGDDFDSINNTMSSGQAAFALQWDYGAYAMNAAGSKEAGDIDFALTPGEGSVPTGSSDGGLGLAITAHSPHPAEALEYALYMASPSLQNRYAEQATPMWKASFTNPSVTKSDPKLFKVIADGMNNITERPQVPYYTSLSNALQVAIQNALQGKQTPQQALQGVAAEIPKLKSGTAS